MHCALVYLFIYFVLFVKNRRSDYGKVYEIINIFFFNIALFIFRNNVLKNLFSSYVEFMNLSVILSSKLMRKQKAKSAVVC